MKLILLAAAAALSAPLLAQTTPATGTTGGQTTTPGAPAPGSTTSPTDPTQTPTTDAPGGATTGQSAPGTMTAGGTQTSTPSTPMTTGGSPVGGYQPSGSAMQGPAQPGVTPTFQQSPTPSQAYPAPAPMASYPPCKKGQYDHCTQTGGTSHKARRRR